MMDTYGIWCASAIASTVVTRSIVAAIFPLISPSLYGSLGDAWACSVFAFLSAACMPVPFLFYVGSPSFTRVLTANEEYQKYGSWIRSKSKYALHDDVQLPEPATAEAQQEVDDKKREYKVTEKEF